mmetsp:Transcript_21351/g.33198  ORF Transcript_21351/g.33198 Transcript_21351/m.33198 type:complete len:139 (-) Transcript_21351:32-448(-)|eukprot:CAMPEP_0201520364 /NCGR_PEP_ID=MMETSP0161_2-20130828/10669_1 /ASSEMBLY_ACC=CAM_ASM_000251 /TAXON_ID=180227 /ORGANISM="Neoparamoeba aestuarina, Strain SoJaBio B1-5/56/2" /LENGTH=138 /DNA_ID=CAMNT_0047918689 /DNA_START=28 /DNA_END=444 /DNA_ORIENTATION=-
MEGIIKGSSLNSFFRNLMQRFPQLKTCLIFDNEGVQLLKVSRENVEEEAVVLEQYATHAKDFGVAMEQAQKLNMGSGKSMISFTNHGVMVHLNFNPLVVSLVGDEELNCGALVALHPELGVLIDPIRESIQRLISEIE